MHLCFLKILIENNKMDQYLNRKKPSDPATGPRNIFLIIKLLIFTKNLVKGLVHLANGNGSRCTRTTCTEIIVSFSMKPNYHLKNPDLVPVQRGSICIKRKGTFLLLHIKVRLETNCIRNLMYCDTF